MLDGFKNLECANIYQGLLLYSAKTEASPSPIPGTIQIFPLPQGKPYPHFYRFQVGRLFTSMYCQSFPFFSRSPDHQGIPIAQYHEQSYKRLNGASLLVLQE